MKKHLSCLFLALIFILGTLSGCGESPDRIVGSCAGFEVPYEELRMETLLAKAELEERYGSGLWDSEETAETYRAELEALVADRIEKGYLPLVAANALLGISTEDPEIRAAVENAVKEAVESYGGEAEYRAMLESHYMTERLARRLLAVAELELRCKEKIEADLFTGSFLESETTFAAWLKSGNLVRVRRVTLPLTANATEVRLALLNGEEPEDVISPIRGAALSAAFYLVRGYADETDLEEDAFELSASNPVGSVAETEAGYRLLIWEEPDFNTFETYQLPTYFRNLRNERYRARKASMDAEYAQTVVFQKNEFGKSLDLTKMK